MDADIKRELMEILTALENLSGTDFPRKNTALMLREALETASDQEVESLYCSDQWWGGAESMADFIPEGSENRRNYVRFLIRLAGTFGAAGIWWPRAAHYAEFSQKWLDDGVI